MTTVRQLLQAKNAEVWTVRPDALVYEALQMMAEKDVGALPVVEGGRVVGIFSERDYARKVVLKGKSSRTSPVREMMTARVLFVSPAETVEECMKLMTEKRVRHLPVLEEGRLVGIVSIGDAVKKVIADQQFTIEVLEKYITGGR
ncbi:MAG: CBS domain-containing protein [Candidatus Eisenbacteria bacterium]|nr:CBS domain-containing protein [Candidatus Eisenbacteria bacterium]